MERATKSRIRLWAAVAAGIAVLIAIGLVLAVPKQEPEVPMPNPNGWVDFMAACRKTPTTVVPDNPTIGELRDFVAARKEALDLVRKGLEKQTCVFSTADFSTELAGFKRLALAFSAEGRLAAMENRPGDAAKIDLELIRFGQQCARGGPLLHFLVAIACENIGLTELERFSASLNAQDCRASIQALEALNHSREPVENIFNTTRRSERERNYLYYLVEERSLDSTFEKTQAKLTKLRHRYVALEAGLAARAYQLEKGKAPQQISDLVPEYLKTSPVDPATGKELEFSLAAKYLQSK